MTVRYPLLLLFVATGAAAMASTADLHARAPGGAETDKPGVAAASPAPAPHLTAVEIASNNLAALPQWTRVLKKVGDERSIIRTCDANVDTCPSPGIVAWRAKIQELRRRTPPDQLWEVNRFINTWTEKPDKDNYGAEDYWASPLEFMSRSGDSEDFAITKFFTLRELGFTNRQLRIVVAKDILRNKTHSFLTVHQDDKIYILDNISNSIITQDEAKYYFPFYSVNETTRWAHIVVHTPPGRPAAGPTRGVR